MALQKTYTLKGVPITDAYHKIKERRIRGNVAIIIIGVYKDFDSSSNEENQLDEVRKTVEDIDGGDQNFTDYVLTPHATENILQRLQTYLIEKEADYSGASEV